MSDRSELQAAQEAEIIRRLTLERPGKILPLLVDLAQVCPAPLSRWFTSQSWKILGLALDRCLAGDLADDPAAWVDWLATVPQDTALALANGKPAPRWKPTDDLADSAAARMGGFSRLCDIPDQGMGLISWVALCRRLSNAGRSRFVLAAFEAASKAVEDSTLDDGPSAAAAAGIEQIAAAMAGQSGTVGLGDALNLAIDAGHAGAANREAGKVASWGLEALDRLVPLRPGGLYILAGTPGGGKTSLALQATEATAATERPGSVAYVSEEMPATQLAVLLAARSLGISAKAITEGQLAPDGQEMASLRLLADRWSKTGAVGVLDAGTEGRSTTARAITWMRMRHQISGGNLALIIVDHLGLLESDNAKATEYQRVNETTRALKRIAMQLKVPIIALCQMNRAGRKATKDKSGRMEASPEPVMEDLHGSGSIEKDSDAVVMLHRPNPTLARDVPVTAYIRKNREGPLGSIKMIFHAPFQTFSPDLSNPDPGPDLDPAAREYRRQRMTAPPSTNEDLFR